MRQDQSILIQVILFVSVAQLAMGLYLPSLPAISNALHATDTLMQQSFSLFAFCYGFSQLFYGPLSDRFGRKPLLLIGMSILFLGTLWAALTTSIYMFLLARTIQGLGAGSAAVLARSIISDRFQEEKLAKAMAIMVFAVSITPALSPYMGGLMQEYFNWRSIFIFLTLYSVLMLGFLFWKLPETNQYMDIFLTKKFSLQLVVKNYVGLLGNSLFIYYVLIIVLGFALQLLSLTLTPFILQNDFFLSPERYGQVMVLPACAYVLGNYFSIKLNNSVHYANILLIGIGIACVGSSALLLFSVLHIVTVVLIITCIAIVIFGYGFIASNAVTGAIAPFKHLAGLASSLLGFFQMAGSGAVVALVGCFKSTPLILGVSFLVLSIGMLALIIRILSKETITVTTF